MQSDSTLNYKAQIQGWSMSFELQNEQLHISGSNKQTKESYNAYYDNLSLPERIYQEIGTTEDLINKIKKANILKIQDNTLVIMNGKNKTLFLPLVSNHQIDDYFQSNVINVPFSIKKVSKNIVNTYPYIAAVYIVAFCENSKIKDAQITCSGVLIKNNIVLTVAHAVYNRLHNLEAKRVSVFIQSGKSLKQVRVKKHYFPQQYKTVNLTDLPKYDFAILQLEDNTIVTQKHLLQMKWNWVQESQLVEVIGFSKKLDLFHDPPSQYHMKCKVTARYETFLSYYGRAETGISGAPIVIFQDNKFKIIGLHQGLNVDLSKGILLSSFSQNPYQILSGIISSSQELPKDIFSSCISLARKQKDQIVKLKQTNQFLLMQQKIKDKQFDSLQEQMKKLKKQNKQLKIYIQKIKVRTNKQIKNSSQTKNPILLDQNEKYAQGNEGVSKQNNYKTHEPQNVFKKKTKYLPSLSNNQVLTKKNCQINSISLNISQYKINLRSESSQKKLTQLTKCQFSQIVSKQQDNISQNQIQDKKLYSINQNIKSRQKKTKISISYSKKKLDLKNQQLSSESRGSYYQTNKIPQVNSKKSVDIKCQKQVLPQYSSRLSKLPL